MVYCGYCGVPGHNRRGCTKRKEQLAKDSDNGCEWSKRQLAKKAAPRRCSFCHEEGHDRRKCQVLTGKTEKCAIMIRNVRTLFVERAKEQNFGCGSLVTLRTSVYEQNHGYKNVDIFGVVTSIDWDRVNFDNEFGRMAEDDPVCVLLNNGKTQRCELPFEICSMSSSKREHYANYRFSKSPIVVSPIAEDSEIDDSLSEKACMESALKLMKAKEFDVYTAERYINAAYHIANEGKIHLTRYFYAE